MPFSMEWVILVLIFCERWSIFYCIVLLYLLGTRICFLPKEIKRIVLRISIFNDWPLLKNTALKLFNPDYSEVKDRFGKLFCCKCGEQHGAPGVRPGPSDQGQLNTCTLHGMAKAMVSSLDRKSIDAKQEEIEKVLQTSIGTTDRQWPSSFDGKVMDIQGTLPHELDRMVDMKIKLNVTCVVTTNQIPNDKFEYILCTSYLSPNDLHSVYIENKNEETGLLKCINSWGDSNEPYPEILVGENSNTFYRVHMEIMEPRVKFQRGFLDQNKEIDGNPEQKVKIWNGVSQPQPSNITEKNSILSTGVAYAIDKFQTGFLDQNEEIDGNVEQKVKFYNEFSQPQPSETKSILSTGVAYAIDNNVFQLSDGKRMLSFREMVQTMVDSYLATKVESPAQK